MVHAQIQPVVDTLAICLIIIQLKACIPCATAGVHINGCHRQTAVNAPLHAALPAMVGNPAQNHGSHVAAVKGTQHPGARRGFVAGEGPAVAEAAVAVPAQLFLGQQLHSLAVAAAGGFHPPQVAVAIGTARVRQGQGWVQSAHRQLTVVSLIEIQTEQPLGLGPPFQSTLKVDAAHGLDSGVCGALHAPVHRQSLGIETRRAVQRPAATPFQAMGNPWLPICCSKIVVMVHPQSGIHLLAGNPAPLALHHGPTTVLAVIQIQAAVRQCVAPLGDHVLQLHAMARGGMIHPDAQA